MPRIDINIGTRQNVRVLNIQQIYKYRRLWVDASMSRFTDKLVYTHINAGIQRRGFV